MRKLGLRQHDIERMLRRRELAVVHPGVYVERDLDAAVGGELVLQRQRWAGQPTRCAACP